MSPLRHAGSTNLVIMPTRERPEKAAKAIEAIAEHSVISDVALGLDLDDHKNYPDFDYVQTYVSERKGVNGTLNQIAMLTAHRYETITFLGDDNIPRTPEWDKYLYGPIKQRGYGVSYGNDGYQGEKLPTAAMMSTNIIKALGYMSPPAMKHMFIDNFWGMIGQEIGAIFYFPSIHIEHMHYLFGKSEPDELYLQTNSKRRFQEDEKAWKTYLKLQWKNDVAKVKRELGIDGK